MLCTINISLLFAQIVPSHELNVQYSNTFSVRRLTLFTDALSPMNASISFVTE